MAHFTTFASATVLPVLLGSVIASLAWLQRAGFSVVVATSVTWTGVLIALVLLERLLPWNENFQRPDDQLFHDFGHTVIGSSLGSQSGALGAEAILVGILAFLPIETSWFSGLPFGMQVAVGFLVVDLTRYVQHRVQHRVLWLWETHKLHHDATRLIAIKAGRSHFFDRALQGLCIVPLALLGASVDVLFWCVALNSTIGLIAHANIDARLGLLGFLVVGPEAHRVHHARAAELHHSNFGAALMIWDVLFGTFRRHDVDEVGLEEETPTRFAAQLAAPINAWLGYAHR